MAISRSNILVHSLSGRIGRQVVFRFVNGKTIVSASPDFSGVTWSKDQKDHRARFREAAKQAKALAADPEIRKKYEEKLKPGYTVYNLILKELLK
jgi:hypothetical protein